MKNPITIQITMRHDWRLKEIQALFELPFNDLLFQAQQIHRHYFDANRVELCTLLSIKTGACPEDCAYCPQSGHYKTGTKKTPLIDIDAVKTAAIQAKKQGASRFCMGAAWRSPTDQNLQTVIEQVKMVKALGLETCVTLGMLNKNQTQQLKDAGLDYYNHNLDTSPEYYEKIITTRTYQERLDTLAHVRNAGINVCCGGIIGMGESRQDRMSLLQQLANLPSHPESVPINHLIPIKGTPLGETAPLDTFEFVRMIATTRILMPKSKVRLSAGRESISDELQALCFLAGANSIFLGDILLVTSNPTVMQDKALLSRLGITC